MSKTFHLISLGCFRNTYDSQVLAKELSQQGYVWQEDINNIDLVIVNTCGFIEQAKKESIEEIRKIINLKKRGKIKRIFVFGCLVKRYRKELEKAFPQVDIWQEVKSFSDLALEQKNLGLPFISFLKICEGCLNNCSYCAIPKIKGSLRSKSREEIIKEAKLLKESGIKELNIIGQDITSWGKDFKNKESLADLLKDILKTVKDIPWIRLLYLHPRHITDDLLDIIASQERICKYIDLPLQHINNRILRLMNRNITKEEIIELIEKIRNKIPQAVIKTSFIVGFPTEKEEEFKELLDFVESVKFPRLGAFIYSQEEGTSAYNLKPQIHVSTKKRRLKQLMSLQQDIAFKVNQGFVGKRIPVLVEAKEKDYFIGRSQYDAYEVDGVVFLKKDHLKIGKIYLAKIVDSYGYDLVGS